MSGLCVLVVDDSGLYRRILSQAVTGAAPGAKVLAAGNGVEALELLGKDRVDLCLLDVNMPVMDGLATLERMKRSRPLLPVIMVSGDSRDGAALTVQALRLGALDFLLKPLDRDFGANMLIMSSHLKELLDHIRGKDGGCRPREKRPARRLPACGLRPCDLVVIASSTGGGRSRWRR